MGNCKEVRGWQCKHALGNRAVPGETVAHVNHSRVK